ncbi:uncharacterized protein LOC143020505 [Oratosquilla oratoria]|uniref:uncharacterized protein LOC143020505 n=1 Tax=Oratosquilla oratoria TaxID=337810 RepID=UPI003F76EE9E
MYHKFTINLTYIFDVKICVFKTICKHHKKNVTRERSSTSGRRQMTVDVVASAGTKLQYNTKISYAAWPPVDYLATLALSMGREVDLDDPDLEEKVSDLAKEYAMVDISFETMNSQVVRQEAKYKLLDLFVMCGAILSLYLGISLILFIEVIEFLLNFFVNFALFAVGKYSRPTRDLSQGSSPEESPEASAPPEPAEEKTLRVTTAPATMDEKSSAVPRTPYGNLRKPHRDVEGYYARLPGAPSPPQLPHVEEFKTLRNLRAKSKPSENEDDLSEFFMGI